MLRKIYRERTPFSADRQARSAYSRGKQVAYEQVTLKAFDGPDILNVQTVATPPEPAKTEAPVPDLVTSAAFIGVMICKGRYPEAKEKPPFASGYGLSGIIDALGQGVAEIRVGGIIADLTTIGACSEYVAYPQSA